MGKQSKRRNKRSKDETEEGQPANKAQMTSTTTDGNKKKGIEETLDNLKFEDPFVDEFEEEDIVSDDGLDDEDDEEDEAEDPRMLVEKAEPTEQQQQQLTMAPWTPKHGLQSDEILEMDESAYKMHHALNTEWPSLSLSLIHDSLGLGRTRPPHTLYAAAGTQTPPDSDNYLSIMKLSSLCYLEQAEDEFQDSDDEDSDDDSVVYEDPVLQVSTIPLKGWGGVNRVRTISSSNKTYCAAWTEEGGVGLFDITPHLNSLDTHARLDDALHNKPLLQYKSHQSEGFALDFNKNTNTDDLKLLSGDCSGAIHLWNINTNPEIQVTKFYDPKDKNCSVEDVCWSPSEQTVFASCDTSGCIKIFDTRCAGKFMLSQTVSNTDVNVLGWNQHVSNLMASGDDNGVLAVWDLRSFGKSSNKPNPLARLTYSDQPITSLEWHPTDESMLCVTDEDATYLYDLSIEEDEGQQASDNDDIPPQLLFVHCGSEVVKEARWHPQIPSLVMTTALSGYTAFIPSNL